MLDRSGLWADRIRTRSGLLGMVLVKSVTSFKTRGFVTELYILDMFDFITQRYSVRWRL
jgi:hypothetical protein